MRRALCLMALLALACGEEPRVAPKGKETPAPSGEAICQEHGIQEAICTRCNPALIAVFRAKGDFCEEHGFPQKACPICHPEKKGKIVVALSEEEEAPPPDGTRIRFKTKDTTRLAGIRTAKAREHANNAVLVATATIAYDATRFAQVNARAAGVVRELKADLGTRVEAGAPLAVIQSASVGAERSRRKGAAASLEVAKANYERVKTLVEEGVLAEKDLLSARAALDTAKAEYEAANASLGEIDQGARLTGGYTLTSPIAGEVIRRAITLGQSVDTEEILFAVADTSSMWAEIDIPETALSRVFPGQKVAVTVDSLPEREFIGTISYIAPEVDRKTRTVRARAALENPDGLLKANMFASALLLGEERKAVVVPRSAVQRARGVQVVFVRLADDLYETRWVTLLPDPGEGDWIGIASGLSPGEEVVTEGSFLLKTETLKESIGAGCCAEE